MAEADEWETACAVALVDAAVTPMAAAHSTTNVFKGQNPGTGGCGGIVYTTAVRTARSFHNYPGSRGRIMPVRPTFAPGVDRGSAL
jgi:hypothetical protein